MTGGWHMIERSQRQWWDEAVTEARGRLARIDRGETTAPDHVVRVLRVFIGPEVRR